ncbi:MAG: molybdopterin cofactor-binding domain-containing protein, partial [Acidobacteriaceae bacterium]
MKGELTREQEMELEPHSLRERLHWFELDRRDFLRLCGGGLLVCLNAGPVLGQHGSGRREHELPKAVSAWLYIDAKGKVTVFTGKVEIGQNIRTSLAQQVAEELRCDFDAISMMMGDTDLTPWDMGTFGSRTTPTMGPELRTMAAAARQMLVDAAAQRWGVDAKKLVASGGKVSDAQTGRSLGYGEITRGEKLTGTVEGEPALTPASEWKVAGKPLPKVDGRDFVTGKHRYPSDIVRPGMMFGKVLRPAGFHATLVSLDTTAAEKIPGAKVVRDGDFVGIAAP